MNVGPKRNGVKHLANLFDQGSKAVRNATGAELQQDTSADAQLAEHDARRRSQSPDGEDGNALRRRSSYLLTDRRLVTPGYADQAQLLAAAKARADQEKADRELAMRIYQRLNVEA